MNITTLKQDIARKIATYGEAPVTLSTLKAAGASDDPDAAGKRLCAGTAWTYVHDGYNEMLVIRPTLPKKPIKEKIIDAITPNGSTQP
jgi:hypothetical protein